ncbi:FecR family protein [Arachidicoccus terrestris]|uniref:FecR family protein n=1 Tax=Arachidicoccus terrestris TaxID=2875539 RepID=UPI001CC6B854|nr:FecR family protein [Arachidicoccus terrestris]UAY55546.1 DUF4974 domain-containing protein [Arachidicoccus terrestris]
MNSAFTPEDIDRFLNNDLEGEKAEKIAAYLKERSGQELGQYLSDEEFYSTKPVEIPHTIQLVMRKTVRREVRDASGKWKKSLLIAACLIGFFLTAHYLLKLTAQNTEGDLDRYTLSRKTIRNSTAGEKYVHLPDGSGVLLKPDASVSYQDNFTDNRFVYLEGKARFDVKHNATRPFTVVANGIGTLDIGTSFWINSDKSKEEITVQLLEGRVAVKSLENSFPEKNIYLQPGQQIRIKKRAGGYLVSNMYDSKHRDAIAATAPSIGDRQMVTTWTNAAYSFSKSPLQKVFEQLSIRYQVEIKIDPHLLENREFTGKIMYADSLNILLDAICNLNHLHYTRSGNTIQITEQQ